MIVRNKRRKKSGVVLKASSLNTISVLVETLSSHDRYKKVYRTSKKYLVHIDDNQSVEIGDTINIVSCRPLSKRKNWRVLSEIGNDIK
jgi:small subunit ribosomal protein S17